MSWRLCLKTTTCLEIIFSFILSHTHHKLLGAKLVMHKCVELKVKCHIKRTKKVVWWHLMVMFSHFETQNRFITNNTIFWRFEYKRMLWVLIHSEPLSLYRNILNLYRRCLPNISYGNLYNNSCQNKSFWYVECYMSIALFTL